ncbi:MAG TPA: hypothetical protein VIJ51_05560 [Solirubrobacteraceae bacterium]
MRTAWTLGICLAGAAAVVLIAVGATYLSVDAGSLPAALGKVAGSTAHRTERGFFVVMVGGLLLLMTILATQFRPGGALALSGVQPTGEPAAPTQPDPEAGGLEGREGTEYPDSMDDEIQTDPILEREARRREERRAVEEAGGGESEGFELAEAELIEHASHGDDHTPSRIMQDAVGPDEESVDSVSGESDEEHLPD